jgi:taurine dioxygenase
MAIEQANTEDQSMAEPTASQENARYNEVAIKVAEELHAARTAIGQQTDASARSLDQRFGATNRAGLGVALEYERMGNAPVSEQLLASADAAGVEFEHLGTTLGTVLHNIDLRGDLSPELVGLIRTTLLERKVIFFRDQSLSEGEQVVFARRFGDLDAFPFGKAGDNPYILEIHHDENRPGTENLWHTDVTWMERPSLGSVAQCVKAPPAGGDTLFSDSHACYLGLPSSLAERVEHLHGVNDYRVFIGSNEPVGLPEDLVNSIKADIPFGVTHPLVRTHPETGKPALYIHGGFLRHDSLFDSRTGEPVAKTESQEIVKLLLAQHSRPEYVCRFEWREGSVAFWDNRAVQHYAASDYYPCERLLRRVTVSGDKPFYDPSAQPNRVMPG